MAEESENVETKEGFWHNCFIARAFRFIKYNRAKKLTARAIFLSAYYRLCILTVKPKNLHKRWGVEGEETGMDDILPW